MVKTMIKLRRLLDAYVIKYFKDAHKHSVTTCEKTDQAARMRSSCCQNTSAQPYRGTHIYARINEYRWTMRSLNGHAGEPRGNKENITFAHLQRFKHISFTLCFVIETYEIGLLCSAHAALVRACTANRKKDTVCQVRTTYTKIRLHSKLN